MMLARTARRRDRKDIQRGHARSRHGVDPLANSSQRRRPTTIPSGTPTIAPMVTATLDSQATTVATHDRRRPSTFSTANSRRRRCTDEIRVMLTRRRLRRRGPPPRIAGIASINPESTISVGRRSRDCPSRRTLVDGSPVDRSGNLLQRTRFAAEYPLGVDQERVRSGDGSALSIEQGSWDQPVVDNGTVSHVESLDRRHG